jgi:hypothetical protein
MQATIQATTHSASSSSVQVWSGRFLSALAILFLVMDGGVKVLQLAAATDSSVTLGLRADLTLTIGILELACLAVYAFPRTATLGAILLAGYLGGAMAIQLRVDAPAFNIIFPLIIGALVWGGIVLRDARLRAFIFNR